MRALLAVFAILVLTGGVVSGGGGVTSDGSATKVSKSGDTMTGKLTITPSSGNALDVYLPITNSGASNGGAVAIDDTAGLRFVSTGSAPILSSMSATGGVDNVFYLDTANSFASSDYLFDVRNAGTNRFRVDGGGNLTWTGYAVTSGAFYVTPAATGHTFTSNQTASSTGSDFTVETNSVVRTAGNLASFNNNGTTKAFVKYDGAVGLGSVATASLRGTCTNGEILYDSTTTNPKMCRSNAWVSLGNGAQRTTFSGYSPYTTQTSTAFQATNGIYGTTVSITFTITEAGAGTDGTGTATFELYNVTNAAQVETVVANCNFGGNGVAGTISTGTPASGASTSKQYALRLASKTAACTTAPKGNMAVTFKNDGSD